MPLLPKAPMALAATGSGLLNLEIQLPGPVPVSPPPKGGEGKTGYKLTTLRYPEPGSPGESGKKIRYFHFYFGDQ